MSATLRTRQIFGAATNASMDSKKVLTALERAQTRNVRYGAGAVRKRAQQSMRRRKKASAPGTPPSKHKGNFAKSILWEYQNNRQSAIIGPTTTKYISMAHEFGGTFTRGQLEIGKRKRRPQTPVLGGFGTIRLDGITPVRIKLLTPAQVIRAKKNNQTASDVAEIKSTEKLKYPARPFMRPALVDAQDEILKKWAGSVR